MNSHCLIFLSMILSLPSIHAQTPTHEEGFDLKNMRRGVVVHQEGSYMGPQVQPTSFQNPDSGVTIGLRPWRTPHAFHHHRHLRTAHGVVNIIGWGMLLPIGVIVARYFGKLPLKCNEWYSLHIKCQTSGFILGTIGWGLGMVLRNASKQHSLTTHGVLGTIIISCTTLQVVAICWQPKEEHGCRRCWVIYHHLLGYALIALIIANIFQGIDNQSHSNKWKWFYVAILGVLASTALVLEIFRCFK